MDRMFISNNFNHFAFKQVVKIVEILTPNCSIFGKVMISYGFNILLHPASSGELLEAY